jgi:CRP-like cAMP-binding protein
VEPERIAGISTFAGLPETEIAAIAGSAFEREVADGEFLVAEGDFGHVLFVIESGTAEILRGSRTVDTVGPGDVIGEGAVLASGRRIASIRATSPTRLVCLFKRDVWRLDRNAPLAAERLRAALGEHRAAREADPADSAG